MADPTTATTGTMVLCMDDPHANLIELMRAMERVKAQVYTDIALPPDIIAGIRHRTVDEIHARMDEALPTLLRMQVRASKLLSAMPAKVHRKRRWMSWAYHRRIQKKWNKRFGVGPVAVLMNRQAMTEYVGQRGR